MIGRVYFVESNGRIKIGYSRNVEGRVREMQVGSSARLNLLCDVSGSRSFERAIHLALAAHRKKGEWFDDCKEVRDTIANIQRSGYAAIGFTDEPDVNETSLSPAKKVTRAIVRQAKVFRTRKEFADAVGCAKSTVDNWKSGKRSIDIDAVMRLFDTEHDVEFFEALWNCLPERVRERWLARHRANPVYDGIYVRRTELQVPAR
ncbi:GIY-YIG nuclease family protein [Bradyrhizobium sp. 41S5]|uniref:T5orf172 domain-containing protein n=1 Tax=Bradyrhizobium erythrophlei TaxID=1437360 RepID=A0A1H4NNI7_9BRAD|nr:MULTISPECIES: GIY-YIG nuclease family protein [Bradyrhizobium]UFX42123.1 GIY-YIG nuclease family protein [Bradyrhizobium sp. 41S5]SEB96760.1 T5orf172 domain-containing protein [Bradyrhizobium erythrophlei]